MAEKKTVASSGDRQAMHHLPGKARFPLLREHEKDRRIAIAKPRR